MSTAIKQQLHEICESSACSSISLQYGTGSKPLADVSFTRHAAAGPDAAGGDQRYLVASITKPVVAMAFLQLVASGRVSLSDRIAGILESFKSRAFRSITFRHLLTHTSGLPDMLPENTQLRSDNSTLNQFLEAAQQVEPEFQPGTDSRYSSVGFLLLGAAIETITGTPLDRYLHDTFFEPLGMGSTWLGLPQDAADQLLPTVMPCELPAWQTEARHWDWNSRYWRTLGAPWGGLISTASDLGCFAREILTSLRSTGQSRCVNSAAARSAILDQTQHYTSIPQAVRQARPWGLGWRRQWPAHAASFGDLVSSETVGHWGATGTVMWFDPVADRYCVILSTTPYEISCSTIQRLSNVVAASS